MSNFIESQYDNHQEICVDENESENNRELVTLNTSNVLAMGIPSTATQVKKKINYKSKNKTTKMEKSSISSQLPTSVKHPPKPKSTGVSLNIVPNTDTRMCCGCDKETNILLKTILKELKYLRREMQEIKSTIRAPLCTHNYTRRA